MIATSSKDGWVRVFDVTKPQPILRFRAHAKSALSVAFTDTNRLVSAGRDGKILWWILDADELEGVVNSLGIAELTPAEAQRVGDIDNR